MFEPLPSVALLAEDGAGIATIVLIAAYIWLMILANRRPRARRRDPEVRRGPLRYW